MSAKLSLSIAASARSADDGAGTFPRCRLRLGLATRCCPELRCPWEVGEHLLQYLAKLDFIPPACRLSAADEMLLLRQHASHPAVAARGAYLQAALSSVPPVMTPRTAAASVASDFDDVVW